MTRPSDAEMIRILREAIKRVRDEHSPRTPTPPPGRNYVICIPCARIWPCQTRKTADLALRMIGEEVPGGEGDHLPGDQPAQGRADDQEPAAAEARRDPGQAGGDGGRHRFPGAGD